MSSTVTIKAVSAAPPRDWSNDFGSFKGYTITIEDGGGNTRDVEWSRKPGNEPRVGDVLETEFREIQQPPGWALKNVKIAGAGTGSGSSGGSGGRAQKEYGWQTNPVDAARMGHSSARDASIQAVRLACDLGIVKPTTPEELFDVIDKTTARFVRQVNESVPPASPQQQPYGEQPPLPEHRRETTVLTGASDVPSDAPSHPPVSAPAANEDPIPF